MEPIQATPATRRRNISTLWALADQWFRLLEFVLVLGVFYVAKEKTHNTAIGAIYWLSAVVLLMWFEELGEFIASGLGIAKRSPAQRWLIWIVAMFASLAVYMITTQAGNAILAGPSK
jgi:hypothetical protein